MNYLCKQKKRVRRREFFVGKIGVVLFGTLLILFVVGLTVYSFKVQAQGNTPASPSPSAEDIGSRHILNYRLIPIEGALDAISALFGYSREGDSSEGYFRNRMEDVIAPELIDYYEIFMSIYFLNMPEDMKQEFLSRLNMRDKSDQDVRLSNIEYKECDDNPFENFFTECVLKGSQAQMHRARTDSLAMRNAITESYEKEVRDGQGILGVDVPTDTKDVDGTTMMSGYRIASGGMFAKLLQAFMAEIAMHQAQHGVPGDVGSDPATSLPSVQNSNTENIENPSHGPIDNNPQISDDFGTGDSNPFDSWSNFDSNPWMDPSRNQLQQAIDDFGGIEDAFRCLSPLRLAAVADILGTTRVQQLMRADTENINCLHNKPGSMQGERHPTCISQRTIESVTDTALILGLTNKYMYDDVYWNVYLWPEEPLRSFVGQVFTPGSCVWTISPERRRTAETINEVVFIGNEDNMGILTERVR